MDTKKTWNNIFKLKIDYSSEEECKQKMKKIKLNSDSHSNQIKIDHFFKPNH